MANYKLNVLYRNDGNGTFAGVSSDAGVAHRGFGVGVAWADYDSDSYLDIYVVNYINYSIFTI